MDVQKLEESGEQRIKFLALDTEGEPIADATKDDYAAFFQTPPTGWEIREVREILKADEGTLQAHVLSKGKTELAAVEHETGLELILPVAQGVAAALATTAIEGLVKSAWEKWLAVRTADPGVPGAAGRQPPIIRLESATTTNGSSAPWHKDFGAPSAALAELRAIHAGEAPEPSVEPTVEPAAKPEKEPAAAPEQEAAKEAVPEGGESKPLASVQRGKKDKRDLEILDVYWSVRDYRIYRTERGISPHFSDHEATALKQRKRYMDIGPRLSKLNGLLNVRFIADSEAFFNREIARAVALALEGDKAKAEETLKYVEERASKAWQMAARTEYIAACGFITFIVTMVWFFTPVEATETGLPSNLILQVAAMGAWGAFLSVAMGVANLEVDPYADTRYNLLTGVLRIVVGTLGAIVLYFVLRSGIFAGLVVGTGSEAAGGSGAAGLNAYAIYVLSAVAGFSERMVPNVLDRISNQAEDEPDDSGKDNKSGKDN